MKTSFRHEHLARFQSAFGQRFCGIALCAAAAAGLGTAALCQAQSPGQPPKSALAAPQQTLAAQAAAATERQRGGNHEGIKVHGHWVIEVRNPDGKLVSHTEFENHLANGAGQNGGGLLAALLGRTATAGSWEVFLSALSGPGGDTGFYLVEQNSAANSACNLGLSGAASLSFGCSNTLAVTPPSFSLSGSGIIGATLTLSGSFTVTDNVFKNSENQIGYVETDNFACAPSVAAAQCFNEQTTSTLGTTLTALYLDGTGSDPSPVTVSTGQSVNVSVTLSFQ